MAKIYDAVIVGSGACGGWAAMQLARSGMKVLLLEAGADVKPAKQFKHILPYQMEFRGQGKPGYLRTHYQGSERNYKIMINTVENPYVSAPGKPFRWVRSRVLGGRTLHWARATDRMADYEFKAASRDGYGMDWPVTYAQMKPYYDRVEAFIGVSGKAEGFPQFPDGVFLPAMPLNCAEQIFAAGAGALKLPVTPRRLAQLTQMHENRPPCHYCGNCVNGCDVGAMFSSVSSTLPPALRTGNLEVRTDAITAKVRMNSEGQARGVTYIESGSGKSVEVDAKFVILAASTLENTRLLLLSDKAGLANSSGTLGHYLMDQWGGTGVSGFLPKLKGGPARLDDGKAAGISIPNFQNISRETARKDFIRGYVMNASGGQTEYPMFLGALPGYGSEWKREMKKLYPAQGRVWCAGGEMLARKENRVELTEEVKDHWGIPVLKITCAYSDNERKMYQDFYARANEWFEAAGGEILPASPRVVEPLPAGENMRTHKPSLGTPGGTIHEVGTCRMSENARDGVLNSFCQTHDIPNLYVFGGGAFPSTGDKHPTLTMMALTARGCDHLLAQTRGVSDTSL